MIWRGVYYVEMEVSCNGREDFVDRQLPKSQIDQVFRFLPFSWFLKFEDAIKNIKSDWETYRTGFFGPGAGFRWIITSLGYATFTKTQFCQRSIPMDMCSRRCCQVHEATEICRHERRRPYRQEENRGQPYRTENPVHQVMLLPPPLPTLTPQILSRTLKKDEQYVEKHW